MYDRGAPTAATPPAEDRMRRAAPPLRRSAHTPSSPRPHPFFAPPTPFLRPAHTLLRSGNTSPRPQSGDPHDLTTPTLTSRAARILVPPVGMCVCTLDVFSGGKAEEIYKMPALPQQ